MIDEPMRRLNSSDSSRCRLG